MSEKNDEQFYVEDAGVYVDVCVGIARILDARGRTLVEADVRVDGEWWRVHKSDADPYPSSPHAHCIAGAKRLVGCTLHLGTARLYRGRTALDRYLHKQQFAMLLDGIRPKFPHLTFPLPSTEKKK